MSKLLHKLAVISLLGFPVFIVLYRLELISLKPALLGAVASSAGLGMLVFVIAMLYTLIKRRSQPAQAKQARRAAYITLLPIIALAWASNSGGKYPPINDITTDTNHPPSFIHAATLRKAHDNSLVYQPEFAPQQQLTWPDLKSIATELSAEAAYSKAISITQELGWNVTYEDTDSGHIEAVEKTLLWGWQDDIVIRIRTNNGLSMIDIRSCSRSGVGDFGVNAKRINRFMTAFDK